jgi:hypothetical protein
VLAALDAQPGRRLRWYSHQHHNPGLAGRGRILEADGTEVDGPGQAFRGVPLSGYTVRRLVGSHRIRPIDPPNARPFRAGPPSYRDYHTQR